MAHNLLPYLYPSQNLSMPISPEMAALVQQVAPAHLLDTAALGAFTVASAAYLLRQYTWDKPDPYRHIFFERPQSQDGGLAQGKAVTRNIAQRLQETGADAVIFWGSQSGTAEGFANRLAGELRRSFHLNTLAADLSDFDASSIALLPREKLAIFIISTYGEGDPSDNAAQFWEWVTKMKAQDGEQPLAALRYAAFGLGNSQYRYFNRVVDVVDEALHKFGAQRLLPVGRADDANGTTGEDFTAWRDELFKFLVTSLGLQQQEVKYEPQILVQPDDSLDLSDLHLGEPSRIPDRKLGGAAAAGTTSAIRPVKIKAARELFANSSRSCLHLDLDLSEHPQITYKTGDHLAVWGINPDEEVRRLLQTLGLSERRRESILIKAVDPEVTRVQVPSPTTIETLLQYYLEICAPVPRDTVRALAEFAPGPAAKDFILGLSGDRDGYARFVAANHVTVGRLLEMAVEHERAQTGAASVQPWSSLPLSLLIETLPRMQPRYYSISSSSVIAPRNPSITVLVSSTPVATSSIPGLASNYLVGVTLAPPHSLKSSPHPAGLTYPLTGPDSALANGHVYAAVRRSRFKLPALASCPVIMVAAGTGVAPFLAFVAERARLARVGRDVGEMVLFFGCRRPEEDYIYAEELARFAEGDLAGRLRIVTAFSRPTGAAGGGGGGGGCYVQDRVAQHGGDVCRLLLAEDASIYLCGRASMAREVGTRISDMVKGEKGCGDADAKAWVETMKRTRKWQEDVWG